MAQFYPYLIPSLPVLHFQSAPPFSFADFLERCRKLVPDKDCAVLENLPLSQDYGKRSLVNALVEKWVAFDTNLRNEMVKIRAARRHLDPAPYLRPGSAEEAFMAQEAVNIHRRPSPQEAETMFDQLRWKALDDLSAGHYFDLEALIVYVYKLLILERWAKIRAADKAALLEKTLELTE